MWLLSSVDSWFPGRRPLGSRGMASLKHMQLLIDTNIQTGSFVIIVTYSTQSEHPRVSTHERAHTSGQPRQVGSSQPYFTLEHLCLLHQDTALHWLESTHFILWFSLLLLQNLHFSCPPHGPEQKPQSPPCRMSQSGHGAGLSGVRACLTPPSPLPRDELPQSLGA